MGLKIKMEPVEKPDVIHAVTMSVSIWLFLPSQGRTQKGTKNYRFFEASVLTFNNTFDDVSWKTIVSKKHEIKL